MLQHTGNSPPNTAHWRKVRVGFQMSVSSCFTEMSWCQPGGILTCRKCIRAMRLPRWNGVLWGLSAGPLRCNTRPWHCFVASHPKSECIIWNFYPSMATTEEHAAAYGQSSTHNYTLAESEGWVSDACFILFHWNVLMSTRWNTHLQEVHQSNEAPTMEWCSLRVLCWPLEMQHPALALLCRAAP